MASWETPLRAGFHRMLPAVTLERIHYTVDPVPSGLIQAISY